MTVRSRGIYLNRLVKWKFSNPVLSIQMPHVGPAGREEVPGLFQRAKETVYLEWTNIDSLAQKATCRPSTAV